MPSEHWVDRSRTLSQVDFVFVGDPEAGARHANLYVRLSVVRQALPLCEGTLLRLAQDQLHIQDQVVLRPNLPISVQTLLAKSGDYHQTHMLLDEPTTASETLKIILEVGKGKDWVHKLAKHPNVSLELAQVLALHPDHDARWTILGKPEMLTDETLALLAQDPDGMIRARAIRIQGERE